VKAVIFEFHKIWGSSWQTVLQSANQDGLWSMESLISRLMRSEYIIIVRGLP